MWPELTATAGVNAAWPVGVSTRLALLQVWPPSVEVEIATSSKLPPLNRASCHTTKSWPVCWSIAGSGGRSPVRSGAGAALLRGSTLLGSLTPTDSSVETMVGSDHEAPPSADVMSATFRPRAALGPVDKIRSKKSYRVPVRGSTTITLPIVWFFSPGSKICLDCQVTPPSVVLENHVGPLNARACRSASNAALGDTRRSHTTYATPGLLGSAVTDSLSLKNWVISNRVELVPLSALTVLGDDHVRPPFCDVLASTALSFVSTFTEMLTAYAVPSAPMDTHGSEARLYRVAMASPGAAHASNGSGVSVQEVPPSNDAPAVKPCAPPSDQRSCCQAPTRLAEFAGFTAREGSTSELR